MCQKTVRSIHAAARSHLSALLVEFANGLDRRRNTPDISDYTETCLLAFADTLTAYMHAGLVQVEETVEWASEFKRVRDRGADNTTCDDCGATIPTDVAHILTAGDGDGLCLCGYCHSRTTAPCTTADAERGWDGHGDFDDTPAFMVGLPPELD